MADSLKALVALCFIILQLQTIIIAVDNGADADELEWKTATATYAKQKYTSITIEGACGYGDIHRLATYGEFSAGVSSILFNRGSTCGACFEVRCVNHIWWCRQGSPSITLTVTDFCPPNYGLASDYGGWCNFPLARNWGQNWQSNVNLVGQPLSFEVTTSSGRTLTAYNVAPANWRFGQTFEGKQF